MCKSEIFAKIINIVSKETEVSVDQILSSDKKMETVDARYLLVSLLFESGMYPSQIAVHIHKTKRAVNYMISNFHERIENGKMMRIYWESNKLFIINRLSVIFYYWYHTVKIFNSFLSPIEGFFYVFVIPTNSVFKLKNPPIFNKIV